MKLLNFGCILMGALISFAHADSSGGAVELPSSVLGIQLPLKLEAGLAQGEEPRLLFLKSGATRDNLFIDAELIPQAGSRSVIECIFIPSSWDAFPVLARFKIEMRIKDRVEKLDVSHVSIDSSTKTIRPAIYELSFPVDASLNLQTPTTVRLYIPLQLLNKTLKSHANEAVEVVLFFREIQCSGDGKRIGERELRVGGLSIVHKSTGWEVISSGLLIPMKVSSPTG